MVPPILPAALTANNAFAQKRLQKKGIFCLHSKHICLCGGIDVCAFDKVRKKFFLFLRVRIILKASARKENMDGVGVWLDKHVDIYAVGG